MTVEAVMRTVEGPVFRVEMNIASDLVTFQRAVRHHPAMRELVEYLASPDARERVLNRVLSLSREVPDLRYENPTDTPLSVYLLALNVYDSALARVAAQAIAAVRQCWWARMIAEEIMLGQNVRSSARDEAFDIILGAGTRISANQMDGAGEAVSIAGLVGGTGRRVTVFHATIEQALAA